MGELFNEPKKIVKEKKRTYFRILGVVPSITNPESVIGYAILDMQGDRKKYQLRLYGLKQAYALVERYKFDNATIQEGKIVNTESAKSVKLNKTDEKGYPEFNTKKMMLFNPEGKVVGNQCIVILGGIVDSNNTSVSKKPEGYRVIDFNGKVIDLKENELLTLVQSKNLDIQNAKILNKDSSEATLSALKDEFPIITKEEVEELKRKYIITEDDKRKYLEKLKQRAITSTLYSLGLKNKMWKDKDLNIYIKEYATLEYPLIVKAAGECGSLTSRDLKLRIIAACGLTDYFIKGKKGFKCFSGVFKHMPTKNLPNVEYFIKDNHLYNIFKKAEEKDLEKLMAIITIEYKYFLQAQQSLKSIGLVHNHDKNGYNTKPYREYIEYIVQNAKNNDYKGDENKVLKLYNSITNESIKRYLEEAPIVYSMNPKVFTKTKDKLDGTHLVKIKLNMTSNKGIKAIGYTVKKSEEGKTSKDNILYGADKPLRYALSDVDLEKGVLSEITKRATCLGDLLITRKLLLILQGKSSPVDYSFNTHSLDLDNEVQMQLVRESLMIILAIYNLDLAEYLNTKYNIVGLDLHSIGHEDFNLDDSDEIYYQSGCKFNRREIVKGVSWSKSKVSEMSDGLRGAISLNTSLEIDKRLEKTLDYLYQEAE